MGPPRPAFFWYASRGCFGAQNPRRARWPQKRGAGSQQRTIGFSDKAVINNVPTIYLPLAPFLERANSGSATLCFAPPLVPADPGSAGGIPRQKNLPSWPQIEPFRFGFLTDRVVWMTRNGFLQKKGFFRFFPPAFPWIFYIKKTLSIESLSTYMCVYLICVGEPAIQVFFFGRVPQ